MGHALMHVTASTLAISLVVKLVVSAKPEINKIKRALEVLLPT
jgi:hypothetical protein